MMIPFEWDVRVSSKDHTVTALTLRATSRATVRYTALCGTQLARQRLVPSADRNVATSSAVVDEVLRVEIRRGSRQFAVDCAVGSVGKLVGKVEERRRVRRPTWKGWVLRSDSEDEP